MKKAQLKDMTTADLQARLVEMEKEYRQLKINHKISPVDNPAKITADRRDIARAKTELRARQLAEAAAK
ncbi:MAG: 50S ribosomal protein L29 [Candidatus Amulumruptor caecigallinarius]|nr:50S ribosomal protein L29 [Candidatus Amulumruptor caecigallinarius]MCM1396546.1 50S ribosomal protein L29 [Candidatus Amulumruptor caecigallinarius]MCM1453396.1 50S ribosomal protein L29 [bacterium]